MVNNLDTPFIPEVGNWLAGNPNIIFHRTPIGVSRIDHIEIWSELIIRQAIHRGTFGSVEQLIATIENCIAN